MVQKLLIFSLLLIGSSSFAQYKNVTIDLSKGDAYMPCEPSIAISPENPDIIVAGAILDKVYYSSDGGSTWTTDNLDSKYGVFGDPCVVAGPKGDFYYLHLSDPSGKGWMDSSLLDRIVIQRSCSGGKRWTKGVGIGYNGNRDQDKEWADVSLKSGNIAVTWTEFEKYGSKSEEDSTYILFSMSDRKAKKWTNPVRLNKIAGDCIDGDETVEGAVPVFGPEDQIYVAWAVNETIWFDRSLDNGKTWLENDVPAAGIIGGWDIAIPGIMRANGMPVTSCDVSNGPNRGRVYINWCDQRNGVDDTDVWLVYSDDDGITWSEPIQVNDDRTGRHQFFTWMDVDPVTGHIYIVFYDRRNTQGVDTEVFLARSTDGGRNFENILISEKAFTPSEFLFFGDYNNISAYNGVVRPIWTHLDDKGMAIKTALINFTDKD